MTGELIMVATSILRGWAARPATILDSKQITNLAIVMDLLLETFVALKGITSTEVVCMIVILVRIIGKDMTSDLFQMVMSVVKVGSIVEIYGTLVVHIPQIGITLVVHNLQIGIMAITGKI
jgi:hypothetical protein